MKLLKIFCLLSQYVVFIDEVDHYTFATCVEHWMNNRNQCSHVKFDEDKLQEEEVILKMSDFIKTDYGLGRIGLTDKRHAFTTFCFTL